MQDKSKYSKRCWDPGIKRSYNTVWGTERQLWTTWLCFAIPQLLLCPKDRLSLVLGKLNFSAALTASEQLGRVGSKSKFS